MKDTVSNTHIILDKRLMQYDWEKEYVIKLHKAATCLSPLMIFLSVCMVSRVCSVFQDTAESCYNCLSYKKNPTSSSYSKYLPAAKVHLINLVGQKKIVDSSDVAKRTDILSYLGYVFAVLKIWIFVARLVEGES